MSLFQYCLGLNHRPFLWLAFVYAMYLAILCFSFTFSIKIRCCRFNWAFVIFPVNRVGCGSWFLKCSKLLKSWKTFVVFICRTDIYLVARSLVYRGCKGIQNVQFGNCMEKFSVIQRTACRNGKLYRSFFISCSQVNSGLLQISQIVRALGIGLN